MFSPQLSTQQLLEHANNLLRSGRHAAAVDVFRQLLRAMPNNPELLSRLGSSLNQIGQTTEARQHIERAIRLSPNQAMFHHDLSSTYRREGKWKQAEDAIDKALKLAPRHPTFTAAKAELAFLQGDSEKALRVLQPVRGAAGDTPSIAMLFSSLAPRIGAEQEAADALRKLIGRTDLPSPLRLRLFFSLSFVLDHMGDFDGAWEAARLGNVLKNEKWDSDRHRTTVDAAIAAWTPEAFAKAPSASVDGSSAVVIVGMPRSGLGLVAATLAMLPDSGLGGEQNDLLNIARELEGLTTGGAPIFTKPADLTEATLTERGAAYLTRLRTLRPDTALISDRSPMNFLNLPLIAKMLPGATIINCTRDARDSAVACHTYLFSGNFPFMSDLPALKSFIRDSERLRDHWRSLLGPKMVDIAYEDLLARPEATVRKVVEATGRPFADACLTPAREWVQTITLPSGTMRDLVPDGRVGIAKDYAKFVTE